MQVAVAILRVQASHVLHTLLILNLRSAVTSRVPLQEGLCTCITALQSLKARKMSKAQHVLAQGWSSKDMLKGGTIGG